jgi:Domain of unknown function (DUF1741)
LTYASVELIIISADDWISNSISLAILALSHGRLLVSIISKVIHYLRRMKVRLSTSLKEITNQDYYWKELWRSLLGLLSFLVAKAENLTDSNGIHDLVHNLIELLATSLAGGESFLPGTSDYDDLFYKLVLASSSLEKFSKMCIYPNP